MKTKQWLYMGVLVGMSLISLKGYAVESLETQIESVEGILTYTTANNTKLREIRGTDTPILLLLEKGTPVIAKESIGNWYQVEYKGQTGYIYYTQLETKDLAFLPEEKQEETPYQGEILVEYAKQFLGNPYVYAGNSLTNGVDCSGFTTQIYKHFGYSIQRSSKAQYANNGYSITKEELLPGDLVFYGYSGVVNHVAIYAGNQQVIHASSPKTGIKMSELYYGKPIIGFKRIIQ